MLLLFVMLFFQFCFLFFVFFLPGVGYFLFAFGIS